MYTQCPECNVAFRVTAEVLRQAAGKVRCGGCGSAFNALEHLSESRPEAAVEQRPEPQLPELKPDEPGELKADTPPESISAEQSAALLKTLDELAGSDIRIEDTGVEWRIIDEDEEPGDDEAAARSAIEDMRFDDNTPLPDDFDLDTPAIAPPPVPDIPEPVEAPEDMQVDLELGEPDEWQDLLGEVDEPESEPEPEEISLGDIVVLSDAVGDTEDERPADEPPDMDTQFALQAEAMGIDLSGTHAIEEDDDDLDRSIEEDLIAAAFEAEAAAKVVAEEEEAEEEQPEEIGEIELEFEDEAEAESLVEDEVEEQEQEAPEEEAEEEADEEIEEEELAEEPADAEALEEEIEAEALEGEAYSDASLVEELDDLHKIELDDVVVEEITEDNGDFDRPEMSEEEKTINMMIDQDLLAIAVEDEDGFASTIVQIQPDSNVEEEIAGNKDVDSGQDEEPAEAEDEASFETKSESAPPPEAFETIVMEGEFVRGHDDAERNEKNRRLGDELKAKRAEEERKASEAAGPPSIGMVAGLAGLALLLILQVLHQSREALATSSVFNDAIGPVYRMLGKPVTPAWNVTGWTIEATTGSTDENDELLTIYSRIANKSDDALPYPLVHVSLTDRFEDVVGSRVLEPAEYLASDLDPRDPVIAGNTFNAVIAIESPAPNATGYKISVCYRLTGGQLRCAIDDFK